MNFMQTAMTFAFLCLTVVSEQSAMQSDLNIDSCKDLLPYITRTTKFDKSLTTKENFLAWLRTATQEELRNSASQSINLGIVLPEVPAPIKIGLGMTQDDYRNLKTAVDKGIIKQIDDRVIVSFFSAIPDSEGIKAWLGCMKLQAHKYGLIWRSDTKGNAIYLTVQWRPTYGGGPLAITEIAGGVNNVKPVGSSKRQLAAQEEYTYQFTIIDPKSPARAFVSTPGGYAYADWNPPTPNPTLIFSHEWPPEPTIPAGHDGIEFFNFEIPADKIQSLPNDTNAELGCVVTVKAEDGKVANVRLKIKGSQGFNLSPSNFGTGSFDTGSIEAFKLTKGQKYSFEGTYDDEKASFGKIIVEVWSPSIPVERRQKFRNSPK